MLEERVSIVEDTPGVTRDRIYGDCEWLSKTFRLIDTGGIAIEDAPFQKEINAQVEIAVDEADVIIFVVDGRQNISSDDEYIAKLLRKAKKPIIVAVNKIDDSSQIANIYDFYKLGFGDPLPVSGSHGIGVGDLLDACVKAMPEVNRDAYEGMIKFAIIGRPNVGKSSLTNAILKEERVIVSDVEGTTRDAIDTVFTHEDKTYVVIDTAGIRKRGKVYENIEKYSVLRARNAIERADVVLVVIDGEKGIIEQDSIPVIDSLPEVRPVPVLPTDTLTNRSVPPLPSESTALPESDESTMPGKETEQQEKVSRKAVREEKKARRKELREARKQDRTTTTAQ